MEQRGSRTLGRWWLIVGGVALLAAVASALGGAWLTAEALADGRPVSTGVRFLASIGAGWYAMAVARFSYLQYIRVTYLPYG